LPLHTHGTTIPAAHQTHNTNYHYLFPFPSLPPPPFFPLSPQVLCVNSGKAPEAKAPSEVVPGENPLWDAAAAEAAVGTFKAGEGGAAPTPIPAAVAFRYRSWAVGKDINLVARTSVHAVLRKRGVASLAPVEEGGRRGGGGGASAAAAAAAVLPPAAQQYMQIWSLNEWDPKLAGTPEWRTLLDTQKGSVLSTEIKNNAFKLCKFTASALLSGVDTMRLGFVSRATRSDNDNHVIMGTHATAPAHLANSLQFSAGNMWGIIKWLVDTVRKHAKNLQMDTPEDEYSCRFVLARDPLLNTVRLYNVPLDAFDREEGEEVEEGEDGEDEAWL
jgi:hypothetical protein